MDCTKGSSSTLRPKAIKAVNGSRPFALSEKALWQTADTRSCLAAARGLILFREIIFNRLDAFPKARPHRRSKAVDPIEWRLSLLLRSPDWTTSEPNLPPLGQNQE